MTTTIPGNPPPASAGSFAPQVVPSQNVYMMPLQQDGNKPRIIRPVPGVKCLSIATIVIGGVLVVLGIIAIVLKARSSYIANPIWTGLLLLVTTGILGIFVYKKTNNFCMNIAYLVMTIISSVFAYQLMECAWFFAMDEWYGCYPAPGIYFYNCSPPWSRKLVGVAIILCAIAALVLCIVSCSVTIYGTFTCCYNCCRCCRNSGSSPMVQYSSHTGIVMTPVNGQNMQVTAVPQMNAGTQQTTSQPVLVAAPQPYYPYPQNSPPAYMATPVMSTSPQAFVVSNDRQIASGVVSASSGNPSSGDIKVAENKPPATAPPEVVAPTSAPGQIAENTQNWQKF